MSATAAGNKSSEQHLQVIHSIDPRSSYTVVAFVMACVTIAFVPITEPADMTSMALNASRMMELGLLAIAAGAITLAVLHQRCDLSISSRAPLIAFLFCLWAMLSSFWSANPVLTFGRAGTLMLLLYTAVALVIYVRQLCADSARALMTSATWALLGSVVVLLVASVIIWGTPLKFSGANPYTGREARLVFAQAGPFETGEFLSLVIVVTAITIQRLTARILLVGTLFLLLTFTDVRSLMVFIPIALGIAWFQRGSLKMRALLVSLFAATVLALTIFALSGDLVKALPPDIATLNGRVPLWEVAWQVISEHPFLGVGYYTSRYYLMDSHFFAGNAHNAFVETLLTTGLVGLSLLLIFLFHCIQVSIRTRCELLSAMIVLCILGSMFSPLVLSSNAFTFFLFVVSIFMSEEAVQLGHDRDSRWIAQSATATSSRWLTER